MKVAGLLVDPKLILVESSIMFLQFMQVYWMPISGSSKVGGALVMGVA